MIYQADTVSLVQATLTVVSTTLRTTYGENEVHNHHFMAYSQ